MFSAPFISYDGMVANHAVQCALLPNYVQELILRCCSRFLQHAYLPNRTFTALVSIGHTAFSNVVTFINLATIRHIDMKFGMPTESKTNFFGR